MTHAELVARGAGWLRRQGCAIVLSEFCSYTTTGETPDNIGWRDGLSIVLEAKASRTDFLADRRKKFRADPALGMGDWRFFITPPGLLKPEDDLQGWGLLEVHARSVRTVRGGPSGNAWWHREKPFAGNARCETQMLVSALRRLQLHHGTPEFDRLTHLTFSEKQKELQACTPNLPT